MNLLEQRNSWREHFKDGGALYSHILNEYRENRESELWRASRQIEKMCEYIIYLEGGGVSEFTDYVLSFYGPGGVYDEGFTREEVERATNNLRSLLEEKGLTFEGDSVDRERIRGIILRNRDIEVAREGIKEVKEGLARARKEIKELKEILRG